MLTTHHKKAKKGRNVRATAIALGARTNIYLRAEHYWSPHGPLLIAVATNSGAHPRPVLLHTTLHMWSSERATSDLAAVSKKQEEQRLRSRHFLANEGGLLQRVTAHTSPQTAPYHEAKGMWANGSLSLTL